MAGERLQPRKEQKQQLDQTHRDVSPNKGRGAFDHCLLQYQRYDLYQQSKGKGLASNDEEVSLNVSEDGKPMEKIKLRDYYDKDHPGLAGGMTGILETLGMAAAGWAVKKGLDKLYDFGENMIKGKKESAEDKLDKLFMSYHKTGLDHLNNAKMTDDQRRKYSIGKAANKFMHAANLIETGCFVKAKSLLFVAGCHHWMGDYGNAKRWLEKAYEEGLAECERRHPREELAQFRSEFVVPLRKLLESYPPTFSSIGPLLPQFSRLEIASSSTSDRVTLQDENKALQSENQRLKSENQRLKSQLDQALQEKQALELNNQILQRDKRELQNKVSNLEAVQRQHQTLQRDKQSSSNQLDQAKQEMRDMEKTIRELTARFPEKWTASSSSSSSSTGREGTNPQGLGERKALATTDQMAIRRQDITDLQVIRNPERLTVIHTLTGHNDCIRSLAVHDGLVISGSDDKTIKIWDINKGKCINTLTGHNRWINSLAVHDGLVISGSGDKTIKIWDINKDKCINTLTGHNDCIRSLAVHDGLVISGSGDKTIKIWDINKGKCIIHSQDIMIVLDH